MAETLPTFAPDALDARIHDPALARAVEAALRRADDERWIERLHDRDGTLWSTDPAVLEKIANRLGWLDAPRDFGEQVPALEAFGESIRAAGFTAALVAGMGGSSLAPDVLADAFRDIADWLAVRVLDSTDPAAVQAAWDGLDPLVHARDRRHEVGNDHREPVLPGGCLEPDPRCPAGSRRTARVPGRPDDRHHGPRPQPRGDPPSRQPARGLPQSRGRGRSVLGADLRRAGARLPAGHRPRCVPRLGGGDAGPNPCDPGSGESGGGARRDPRRPGRCRPRQADPRGGPGRGAVRRLARAARGREHRQAWGRDRPDRRRAARQRHGVRSRPGLRAPDARRCRAARRGPRRDDCRGAPRRPGRRRAPGPPGRPRRPDRPRGRVRPLGVRHCHGGRGPGDQPLRRAQRHRVEGEHEAGSRRPGAHRCIPGAGGPRRG